MLSKLLSSFEGKDYLKFKIILILNFLTFFLEFISIISIPLFVGLIFDSSASIEKFEEYGVYYFSNFNDENLIKIFGIIVISIFLIKNVFISFNLYSRKICKNIKIKISKKLLNFYIKSSSLIMQKKSSRINKKFSYEDSARHFSGINLFKSLAVLVIFSILFFVVP